MESQQSIYKKDVSPPSTRRLRIPVRTEIHSSEVSTNFERSSFVMRCFGTADPDPTNLEPLPTRLWPERDT